MPLVLRRKPKPRGRPTLYTSKRVALILADIENGVSVSKAFAAGGIRERTGFRWLETRPNFRRRVEEAKRKLERELIQSIRNSKTGGEFGVHDWKASAFLLKCWFPEEYGDKKPDVSVSVSASASATATATISPERLAKIQELRRGALLNGSN